MKISEETLSTIADSSRLNFSESEMKELTQDMQSIISYVDILKELDTIGVEPLLQVSSADNSFREDTAQKYSDREKLFRNAPDYENGSIKVPSVME